MKEANKDKQENKVQKERHSKENTICSMLYTKKCSNQRKSIILSS